MQTIKVRARLFEPLPVGTERHVSDLACTCPYRCDMLTASRVASVKQDHVGIFGENLIEHCPNPSMVLIGRACGEGDPRARGQQWFDFRATLGSEKVAAVILFLLAALSVEDSGGRIVGILHDPSQLCSR